MENFLSFNKSFSDAIEMYKEMEARPVIDLAGYIEDLVKVAQSLQVQISTLNPTGEMYKIAINKLGDCLNQLMVVAICNSRKIGVDPSR